jgi:hypothetical protein
MFSKGQARIGLAAMVPGLHSARQPPAGTFELSMFLSREGVRVTAYDLTGNQLKAYRKRRRKKHQ